MRIGINFQTTYTDISGVEYYCLGLLNGLANIDTQNHYIVYTNQPDLVSEYIRPTEQFTVMSVKYLKTRTARIFWEHTQLPRLAKRHNLDVLHCPSYICPWYRNSIPYVVTVHDTIAIDKPQWCKPTNSLYYNCFLGASTKKASCVISVSKQTAEDLKRNFGLPSSKIHIVHSGIDRIFNLNRDVSRHSEVRKHYNLPEKYILYVGNIEPKKNIWTLLCLIKNLKKKGLPHKLVIAGKRSWGAKAELEQINREIKQKNLIWAGYIKRNDLPCVYQMADVFAFLSLYEGFGFPPLEAMACGTPVVSTSSGALSETIAKAAFIIEPFKLKQISNAVMTLLSNYSLRKKYIEMGLNQSNRFKWEKTAKKTLSVYNEVSAQQ